MPLKGLTEVGKECTSTKKFPCCMSVIWDWIFPRTNDWKDWEAMVAFSEL